jgi:hypothetical protein
MSSMILPSATRLVVAFASPDGEDGSNWELLLSAVLAAFTGFWTLYTWRAEKKKERNALTEEKEKERNALTREKDRDLAAQREREEAEERRRTALYTMPFMMAAEALQSRLYNILHLKGLAALRETYPEGEHADEMLYLVAQYFGWERCMLRYTHYSRVKVFTTATVGIRALFATDTHGAHLRFFHNDQIAMGRLALDRYTGEYGVEFDAVGKQEFLEGLKQDKTLHAAAKQAVDSLQKAKTVEEIEEPTVVRMATLQVQMCGLLEQLEKEQGIVVFLNGQRKRASIPESKNDESMIDG